MSYVTVTPAYGRDYKSQKAARESWENGQDWILQDIRSRWDGKPINKPQADAERLQVTLRYNKLRNTCCA